MPARRAFSHTPATARPSPNICSIGPSMRARDFALLMFVCFIWAANVVVGKIVLSDMAVPPLYYAAIRFALVACLLSPLLTPLPPRLGRIAMIGLLMGAGHFGLLFLGLSSSSPSSAAIVLQLGIPITAVFSVLFLGERISTTRVCGIVTALIGVVVVIWNPSGTSASLGLIAIVASTTSLASGAILLKKLGAISPLRLQAWVGFVSWIPLGISSAFLETNQLSLSLQGGWLFLFAVVFSVVVVTAWAHTAYYSLLQKYEANLIAPLTLAMPIMTMALGIAFTGDQIDARIIVGSTIALAGIGLVLWGKASRPANRARQS